MNLFSEAHIHRIYDQGADAIVRLIHRLTDNIEDLEAHLICQPEPVTRALSKELAKTKRTLARQSDELRQARQLNHQLLRRIRELESEVESGTPVVRDSHNSSLPPSSDPPWKKLKRTRSLRKQTGLKVGGQHAHPGTTLRQVAQPDHLIMHAPEACKGCGASFDHSQLLAFIRRQVFDIEAGRLTVTEHRAEKRSCPHCRMATRAEFPPGVRAPVQYGRGVLSRSVYLHLYQLLPVARTQETMRDLFQCPLSVATILRAARVSSGKLVRPNSASKPRSVMLQSSALMRQV